MLNATSVPGEFTHLHPIVRHAAAQPLRYAQRSEPRQAVRKPPAREVRCKTCDGKLCVGRCRF